MKAIDDCDCIVMSVHVAVLPVADG